MVNLPTSYSFVDIETTGTNPIGDRIIEIGIIRVEDGQVVGSLNTLVNPESYIPDEITLITGITSKDVVSAPLFSDIKAQVLELLADSVFVAHNARFDYGFIKNEFIRHGFKFNSKVLCTVRLARALFPGLPRYGLDSIIENFNIDCENRHRAYDDAHAIWDFYQKIFKLLPQEVAISAIHDLLKSPSLPTHIKSEDIDNLPEGPGVYTFYGVDQMILYIGKSVNVRDRVMSHFSGDYLSRTDLKLRDEVRTIEVIETAGDFSASILESHLIKTLHPIHNKMLRRSQDLIAVVQAEVDGAYKINILPVHTIDHNNIESVLGVFRSQRQAREYVSQTIKENMLCPKVIGLEKGKGVCFYYQIGKCRGACCGEEALIAHNVRFIEAFGKRKVKRWPFVGPIAIKEKSFTKEEVHIVNNWCYLGSENKNDDFQDNDIRFDWDIYKILERFIIKRKRPHIDLINLNNLESLSEGIIESI